MLPTIDPHHFDTPCGGPAHCAYCRSILSETPERGCQRRTAEDRARGLRTAVERDYAPPDAYTNDLQKLRAELPSRRWPEPPVVPAFKPNDFTPPNPYEAALDKLRKEQR